MGLRGWLNKRSEAQMARAAEIVAEREAAGRKALEDYAAFTGGAPADLTRPPSIRDGLKQAFEGFNDAVGEMFDDRRDVLDPGDAQLNKPIPEATEGREAIAAAERAARAAARVPYAAGVDLAFTRICTAGRAQLDDVLAVLRGFDPARVYGVYRVPDRFDLKRNGEGRAYVEWEIAHEPSAAGAGEVVMNGFKRADTWVARGPGDPTVLDEDIAGALVARARLAPEDCFGLQRLLTVRGTTDDVSKWWSASVEGVLLFSRPCGDVVERMAAEVPLTFGAPPFHVEILDWEAVAAWVAPHRHGPARTPSPLPHLPSSWQELIEAYLDVVGVRAADCYGVQATRATDGGISDLSTASMRLGKPRQPCADGEARDLLHVAEHVVVAYRDREEYAAGRTRWRAYQDEVLRARLDHLTGVRPPLVPDDRPRPSFLDEVFDIIDPFAVSTLPTIRRKREPLGPYCA